MKGQKIVKEYLEKQIVIDAALADKYIPDKIDQCWNYIVDQARKEAVNNCAMIEDSKVFYWARHFFLESLWTEEAKREEKARENAEAVKLSNKKRLDQIKIEKQQMETGQISIFDL